MSDVIAEEFKGYSTFTEIGNRMLRAFNQWNVLAGMHENKLDHIGVEYINNLPQTDRVSLAIVTQYIRTKGLDETKRELIAEGHAV
jgi:hypothetical protein